MIGRVVVCAVAVLVVIGLAGGPASAQTKVRKDQVADAVSRVDITSTKVQNNQTNFAVTVRVADVQKRRTGAAIIFGGPTDTTQDVLIEAVPISKGRYKMRGYVADETTDSLTPLACTSATVTVRQGKRGYFRFLVPQSCLGARSGRQATTALAFDKRITDGSIAQRGLSQLRRGDESAPDDEVAPVDFSTTITTRLG